MNSGNHTKIYTQLENAIHHLNAMVKSNAIFLFTKNQKVSYQLFFQMVFRRSEELESYYTSQSSLVGVITNDPLATLVNTFALWKLELPVALLSPFLSVDEITHLKNEWEMDHIIRDQKNYWESKEDSQTLFHYNMNIKTHAITILTSGSTGGPKGVMLSFENLFSSALGTNHFYQIKESDIWALPLPLHHIGGFMIPIRMLMAQGQVFVCNYKNLAPALDHFKIDYLSVVPTQLEYLLEYEALKKLKGIILGGAKAPEHLLLKACKLKLPLANSFGLTEMTAQATSTPICTDVEILKTGGRPLLFRNITISKDHLISFSGETFFMGYQSKKDTKFLGQDLGYFDKEGNLNFLGRKDNIFISGGENINPFILEQKIIKILKISLCKIVPVNHYKFGQVPYLFHNYKKKLTREDFKGELENHEIPYYFKSFDTILSLLSKGKIKISSKELDLYANKTFIDESLPFSINKSGNPKGEVILFFHGFMGSKNDWQPIIDIVKKDYFCISVDLPGHGKTPTHSFTDLDDLLLKLKYLIESMNTKVFLVGYSMGGRIAAQLINNFPHLIHKIVLESSSFGIEDNQERLKRESSDSKLFKNITSQSELNQFLKGWYSMPLFTDLIEDIGFDNLITHKSVSKCSSWQKSLKILGHGNMPYILTPLKKINKNTIKIFVGKKDLKYLKLAQDSTLEYIIFDQSSHNIHLQEKKNYCNQLVEFFKTTT